jgi:hypothetical protein
VSVARTPEVLPFDFKKSDTDTSEMIDDESDYESESDEAKDTQGKQNKE